MDCPGAGRLSREQDRGLVEVAARGRGGTDADGDVCVADMQRVSIRLRMGRDRAQAEETAGALDAERDLPAIGN